MNILLMVHSILRWVIVVVAVVAVVRFAMVWLNRDEGDTSSRPLMAAFTGLLDLQATLGLILLLWSGLGTGIGFPRYRLEHAGAMLIAVMVAHLAMRWRSAPSPICARNNLFTVLATMVLIIAGVIVLPQGWFG